MGNGLGKGNVGFTVLRVVGGPPENADELMRPKALPKLPAEGTEAVEGWTGWRHVRDLEFSNESLRRGGYFTGMLVQAVKKIPPSTMDAEVSLRIAALLKESGRAYLNQKQRKEIHDEVRDQLLPEMPWTYKGVEFVWLPTGYIFVTATSVTAVDRFVLALLHTFNYSAVAVEPRNLARMLGFQADQWKPACLAGQGDLFAIESAGREFLMWLWYCHEAGGKDEARILEGCAEFMMEGPFTLVFDDRKTTVKQGDVQKARETVSALRSGKVLQKCKLALVKGEEVWSFGFDADTFAFRSMKLPQTVNFDMHGKFAERIVHMMTFFELFAGLFGVFCILRSSSEHWESQVWRMRRWIRNKSTENRVEEQAEDAKEILGDMDVLLGKIAGQRKSAGGNTASISMITPDGEEVVLGVGSTVAAAGKAMKQAAKELIQENQKKLEALGADVTEDEIVEQAKAIIRETGRASTSSIQRRLRVGYTKAARIMDILEERGIIGPPSGTGPREVLVDLR